MERHLRICFVAFQFWPDVGGAQVQAEKQARLLQELGHDVMIITLRHERHWKAREIHRGLSIIRVGGLYRRNGVLRVGRYGQLLLDLGVFLALWCLRSRYDLIHTLQLSPLAAVAALVGKLARKPVIIGIQSTGREEPSPASVVSAQEGMLMADTLAETLTDTSFLKLRSTQGWVSGGDITSLPQTAWGGQAMLDFLCRSDAYYQILSTRSHGYLTQHCFRAAQIVQIPNGVDTEKFRPETKRSKDRAQVERRMICVARLEYAKGVDVLLHAWGRMMHMPAGWRSHLIPRLLLVGEGECMAQLVRIAAALGIQESVEFLGLRTDIAELLQQAWGFVLPSRWEGMPNALLEAMACELPCIATRVSGSEDIISTGINGLLVEPEQPAEMAQALRLVIEDTDLALRLGAEARATVVRDYELTSVVQRCLTLYADLLTRNSQNQVETANQRGKSTHKWRRG